MKTCYIFSEFSLYKCHCNIILLLLFTWTKALKLVVKKISDIMMILLSWLIGFYWRVSMSSVAVWVAGETNWDTTSNWKAVAKLPLKQCSVFLQRGGQLQQDFWLQLKHVLWEKCSFQGCALKLVSARSTVCRFQIFSVSRRGITASRFLFYFILCVRMFERTSFTSAKKNRICYLKLQNIVSVIMGVERWYKLKMGAVSLGRLHKRKPDKVGQRVSRGGKIHSFDPGGHVSYL